MKKIETQIDKDKRRRRNNLIVGVIMVVLIGLSSLGYAIMSRTDSASSTDVVKYGNLQFVKSGDYWVSSINSKAYYFTYLPKEVENISIEGSYNLGDYANKAVYFVNVNPATNTLSPLIGEVALRMQEACLANQTCINADLPIKDCSDNVFVFDASSTETKVYKKQNCIFLEGNSFEAVDKLIYKFFNIA